MRSCHTPFRAALLGSALALVALTPAIGANMSRADLQRFRAVHGNQPSALHTARSHAPVRLDPTYTDLHDFAGSPNDGADSGANVTLDDAGNIYGTTDFGGANGAGTVFKLAPDGTQTLLYSFVGPEGAEPDGAVIVMPNGTLYGTAGSGGASGNGTLFKLTAKGKYKVLHDFSSDDGSFLRGRLVRDRLGNFYGTALFGGANFDGTVFKYASDGTFSVLHTFNGADGEFPEHGLARDSAGNLYGVTAFGGTSDEGTVFKIAADGTFSTLYNFTGQADGGFLYGTVDVDKDGNVYGSTVDGGAHAQGTVFKLAPNGTLTTLYNFTGGTDGGGPEGDMLLSGGNLYSTATGGGDPNCGCGVVFEITSRGKEKVLHAFTNATGGAYAAGLTKSGGVFYGTTASYGAHSDGVVFSVTKK
jgi:uncharacterized repeat protein (TIGR03803 family)